MSIGAGVFELVGLANTVAQEVSNWQPCDQLPLGTITLNGSVDYLPTKRQQANS